MSLTPFRLSSPVTRNSLWESSPIGFPFHSELQRMQRDMDTLMNFANICPVADQCPVLQQDQSVWKRSGRVTVANDTPTERVLEVEVPGMTADNLTVTQHDDHVTWEGKVTRSRKTDNEVSSYEHHFAGNYGFSDFEPTSVDVSLNSGVLSLVLYKPEQKAVETPKGTVLQIKEVTPKMVKEEEKESS